MGVKLTKSKSSSILEKTKEQSEEIDTIVENTNNHVDSTTNEDKQLVEKNKNKNKKKKEPKLNKKSSKIKVDKSTNTDNYILPLSSFTEQLVDGQLPKVANIGCSEVNTGYQPELPNKYVQELRTACLQNNTTLLEAHNDNQQIANEHEYQVNNSNIFEDITNNASAIISINNDQIQNREK